MSIRSAARNVGLKPGHRTPPRGSGFSPTAAALLPAAATGRRLASALGRVRASASGCALLLVLCLPHPAHAEGLDPGFGWFAELSGSCWKGTFPDGKTTHEQCYTVQYGRFVRGTARLSARSEGQERTVFEGDSLWAWDPATQSIVYYIWGTDGSHGRHEARYDGATLVFPVQSRKVPGTIALRSVWTRIDADHFEVRRERPAEGGWQVEMTVPYQRSAVP